MTEHAVVIAGGGPTGLMLAGELALAGIDVVVVERRADQELDGTAGRRPARPHHRGARPARRRRAVPRRRAGASRSRATRGIPLDISDFPTRHNYVLALWQRDFERILAGWVGELGGADPSADARSAGFAQDDAGVDVELSDGTTLRARVPRRLRRRAQRGPQGRRHRLRRAGRRRPAG